MGVPFYSYPPPPPPPPRNHRAPTMINHRIPAPFSPINSAAYVVFLLHCHAHKKKSKLIPVIMLEISAAVATASLPYSFPPNRSASRSSCYLSLEQLALPWPSRTNLQKSFLKLGMHFLIINSRFL